MISVPNSTPKTVSFTQVVANDTADIAKAQIGKLALAETTARGELEKANFRLSKATEQLRDLELSYRESVAKSSWNKEAIRTAYNNAIAEYREADKNQQSVAGELSLAKSALEGTRASANGEIVKREFTAEGDLPTDWQKGASLSTAVSTTKSLRKDATMSMYPIDPSMGVPMTDGMTDGDVSDAYDKVLCPDCLGFDGNEGCSTCDGKVFIAIEKSVVSTSSNPFDTSELLTRPFQKSAAYQDYIMKGGPGSGAQPGHPFNGNQHTGGLRTFTRGEMAGKKEGWKQTVARYKGAYDSHKDAGNKAVAEAKALEAKGHFEDAAAKHQEAFDHFSKAHGALQGIKSVTQREVLNGSHGATQEAVANADSQARALYSGERATAANEVARLGLMGDAARQAAYTVSVQ